MSGPLTALAVSIVAVLETMSPIPFAVLPRNHGDVAAFWQAAEQELCRKTDGALCDVPTYLQDGTSAFGRADVLRYKAPDGRVGEVCVIVPPASWATPPHFSGEASGGAIYHYTDEPTKDEMDAFLWMVWGAKCAEGFQSRGQTRADAFAAMALAFMEGDPAFTRSPLDTPARKFAFFRNRSTTEAAIDYAERVMMDMWKDETVAALRQQGCDASPGPSQGVRVSAIPRSAEAPSCVSTDTSTGTVVGNQVSVDDGNLHIWMYGTEGASWQPAREGDQPNPVVGAPPSPWYALKPFGGDVTAATRWLWEASRAIAGGP